LKGWSETQVTQRFVLVGMVAALIGISLALTFDAQQQGTVQTPETPAGQVVEH
jgi:phospho-N-acetylmuramoyl-pentapeptide-transferase